jgi:hypothetical protein
MIKELKGFLKTCKLLKCAGWDNGRIEAAMMHDLLSEILRYFQNQIKYDTFEPKLSRRIDLLQSILDDYYD